MPFSRKSNHPVFIGLEALCHLVRVYTLGKRLSTDALKKKLRSLVFNNIVIKSDGICTSLEQTAIVQKEPLRYSLQIHFPAFSTSFCLFAFVCLFVFLSKSRQRYILEYLELFPCKDRSIEDKEILVS